MLYTLPYAHMHTHTLHYTLVVSSLSLLHTRALDLAGCLALRNRQKRKESLNSSRRSMLRRMARAYTPAKRQLRTAALHKHPPVSSTPCLRKRRIEPANLCHYHWAGRSEPTRERRKQIMTVKIDDEQPVGLNRGNMRRAHTGRYK